jgi:CheY-like chemotaxis protein
MSDSDPVLAGKRLLVVDDEPMLAMDVADHLQFHGAQVAAVNSLEEAAAILASGAALDGAILDIQLGDEEVWPVAEALERTGTPFLFLSATFGLRPLPGEFADKPFLPKPLDGERLKQTLSSLLAGREEPVTNRI